MPKIKTYSLIIDAEVLEFVIRQMLKAFPKEAGTFLCGEALENRKNIFKVDGYYHPPSEATTSLWEWEVNDWFKATKWAATNNKRIIGMAHSHPWKKPYFTAITQSTRDAQLQKELSLTVSLIVNVWEKDGRPHWYFACWLEGFSAALNVYIIKDDKLFTKHQWFEVSHHRFEFPWNFAKPSAI